MCPRCQRFILLREMRPVFGQQVAIGIHPIYDKFYARLTIHQDGIRTLNAFNARLVVYDNNVLNQQANMSNESFSVNIFIFLLISTPFYELIHMHLLILF